MKSMEPFLFTIKSHLLYDRLNFQIITIFALIIPFKRACARCSALEHRCIYVLVSYTGTRLKRKLRKYLESHFITWSNHQLQTHMLCISNQFESGQVADLSKFNCVAILLSITNRAGFWKKKHKHIQHLRKTTRCVIQYYFY